MTSCKDAIKMFGESEVRNKDKEIPAEAKQVKLYFMIPPIQKMDPAALSTLKACEHLALSSNSIDKIANLSGMENLKILSVGRNNIKKLENMDAIADRLEELWMSYNPISSLAGVEKLHKLRVLYVGNCKISDKKELMRLEACPSIEEVVFYGNPLHRDIQAKSGDLAWPAFVMELLPNLRKIDGITCVEWRTRMNEGNEAQLREIFDKMDTDNSGDVDLKEMKAALADEEVCSYCKLSPAKVDEVFAAIDADGSGSLSWEEFKAHFQR